MQNRSKVINKLALVLLSIVVLELVLIGDQVQPVKAIKKKIVLKKLKKLLPFLALVKPKKKIILLPIPIPMFKSHGFQKPYNSQHNHYQRPAVSSFHSSTRPTNMLDVSPMSFVMMNDHDSMHQQSSPIDPMMSFNMVATPSGSGSTINGTSALSDDTHSPMSMLMPSVTMTIQSDNNGSSNIELSTNMMASSNNTVNQSGSLRAPASKLRQQQQHRQQNHQQQQQQQLNNDLFDEPAPVDQPGGEQYYSSPWVAKSPLPSPAKVFRQQGSSVNYQSGRLQQSYPVHQHQPRSQPQPQRHYTMVVARNQWRPNIRPYNGAQISARQQQQYQYPIEQQSMQAQEVEELIQAGPVHMLPVYQSSNGQLHMSPPSNHVAPDEGRGQSGANSDANSEVGLLHTDEPQPQPQSQPQATRSNPTVRPTIAGATKSTTNNPAGRLSSPAAKGKQQATKQPLTASEGY